MEKLKYKDNFLWLFLISAFFLPEFIGQILIIISIYVCRIYPLKHRNLIFWFITFIFILRVCIGLSVNGYKNHWFWVGNILYFILAIFINIPLSVDDMEKRNLSNTRIYDIILGVLFVIIYICVLLLLKFYFDYL